MCRLEKMGILLYVVILVTMWIVFTPGCVRHVELEEDYSWENSQTVNLSSDDNIAEQATLDWQLHEDEISFQFPADWRIVKHESINCLSYEIKNTENQIVRGAVLPEDYYQDFGGEWQVNTEKYATDFMAFSVDFYPGLSGDWPEILQIIYPQLVAEYDYYQVPYQPEVEAISLTIKTGLIEGQTRFIAKGEQGVFDFALLFRQTEQSKAVDMYYQFISRFVF
ncbi:hypothetical protein HN858_01770 [Candidatus Falkowbacteria bacterium]|jgi:hypothetical protein|nr:hypothetical protein [Candidatus Falkowbacteria bacterium]MBT5503537.1 hypothetical protein [Candidatus Falkowbacteria bacterium]MBT6574091.1 hypothetical protein [Candidatus Falkowbacteria bacterium]MBT7348382.1 hypothetical protein [Candidatus Falkowbacteria bacterium]MBT7500664.1 hypothetical protein [Candidatus Falkowbacteria bacterium]